MLPHSASHWPDVSDSSLWPMGVQQAVWIHNRVPSRKTGLSWPLSWNVSKIKCTVLAMLLNNSTPKISLSTVGELTPNASVFQQHHHDRPKLNVSIKTAPKIGVILSGKIRHCCITHLLHNDKEIGSCSKTAFAATDSDVLTSATLDTMI